MAWDPALTPLRDVLAGLYLAEADARRVAQDAGLDLRFIDFSDKAINNWTNILTYAHNNDQVADVIRIARSEYGRNPTLADAEQHWSAQRQQPGAPAPVGPALVAEPASEPWSQTELVRLRDLLVEHFSAGELRDLCFDLGIDYDDLPAQGKTGKARELISYLDRRDRLPDLVARCKVLRPNASWDRGAPSSVPPVGQPVSPPAPARIQQMSVRQKMALVDALLQCQTVSNRQTRDTLVNDLPGDVKHNVQRSSNDRVDVVNMVTTALNYPGGLESFIELVRLYEGNSIGMQGVDRVLATLGS